MMQCIYVHTYSYRGMVLVLAIIITVLSDCDGCGSDMEHEGDVCMLTSRLLNCCKQIVIGTTLSVVMMPPFSPIHPSPPHG